MNLFEPTCLEGNAMLRASLRAKLGGNPCARQGNPPATDLGSSMRDLTSFIHARRPCEWEKWTPRAWQVTKALLFALLRFRAANQHHRTCPSAFIHCKLRLDQVSSVLQLVLPPAHRNRITTITALDEPESCLQRRAPSARPSKSLLLSVETRALRPRIARPGRDGWRWSPSLSVTFDTHITDTVY